MMMMTMMMVVVVVVRVRGGRSMKRAVSDKATVYIPYPRGALIGFVSRMPRMWVLVRYK